MVLGCLQAVYAGRAPSFQDVSDRPAIESAVTKFFDAYRARDVDALMSLFWSASYTDRIARKEALWEEFRSSAISKTTDLVFKSAEPGGDGAIAYLTVKEAQPATANVTGAQPEAIQVNYKLTLERQGTGWKIRSIDTDEDKLAATIVATPGEKGQQDLVESNKDQVNFRLVRALIRQGALFERHRKFDKAMEAFRLAGDVARRLQDKPGLATSLLDQGITCDEQAKYAEALSYYEQSLAISEDAGDDLQVAHAFYAIGTINLRLGRFDRAKSYYSQSVAITENTDDRQGTARALYSTAVACKSQSDYGGALAYSEKSLKISVEIGDDRTVAEVYNNIGNIQRLQGNRMTALQYFQSSLAIKEKLEDRPGTATALVNLGIVYDQQGITDEGLSYFKKALTIDQEMGNEPQLANTLYNIGMHYKILHDAPQALDYIEKALSIQEHLSQKRAVATSLHAIGSLQAAMGNTARALDFFNRARAMFEEIGDQVGVATSLGSLGRAYHLQGNDANAVELEDRSAAIAKDRGALDILQTALLFKGVACRSTGRDDLAAQAFAESIAIIEEMRDRSPGGEQQQQNLLRDKLQSYHEMVSLLVSRGDLNEALVYSERVKARTLLDVLHSARTDITRAMTEQEKTTEHELNARLVSLNSQIIGEKSRAHPNSKLLDDLGANLTRARLDFDAFQMTLYTAHPELRGQRGRFQPITPAECSALVPDSKTALLEFLVTENGSFLFTITRQTGSTPNAVDLKVHRIGVKPAELAALTETLRAQFARRDLGYSLQAARLYDLLLGPAESDLRGKSKLVIVPDWVLWELPFQALRTPQNHFLLEDCSISYAPSLTALKEMSRHSRQPSSIEPAAGTLLALGNPAIGSENVSKFKQVYLDEQLAPLPEAEHEVNELKRLYGPANSKVFTGRDATEARLKALAGQCRVLHLATHSLVDNSAPMYSQVVLARGVGDAEDGLLEAWEIAQLDLKADLVILAGCETARGKISAGEGLIGLTWAVFVAGCPSTVVSQWKVEAQSTTELMIEFHRRLKQGSTKAEALRAAELKLLHNKKYAHPAYWAPFVLIGLPD